MNDHHPLIPAEAGTQSFGVKRHGLGFANKAAVRQMDQTWVPASAGMSGRV
jgi:hypothetical protein